MNEPTSRATSASSALVCDLERFQSFRKFPKWQPLKPPAKSTKSYFAKDQAALVNRLLQFVDLEVEVGTWIIDSMGELSQHQQKVVDAYIKRNSQDEKKHDVGFRSLRSYLGYTEDPQGQLLLAAWKKQPPSFALAYALEMGIFMSLLPWLNRFGDTYVAQLSQWVSDDEMVHVQTNRRLAEFCNQKLTEQMFALVAQTIYYIFQETSQVERALHRLTTGQDKAMIGESLPTTIKFFEQLSVEAIVYKEGAAK
jgi:hypothetical protein